MKPTSGWIRTGGNAPPRGSDSEGFNSTTFKESAQVLEQYLVFSYELRYHRQHYQGCWMGHQNMAYDDRYSSGSANKLFSNRLSRSSLVGGWNGVREAKSGRLDVFSRPRKLS